MRKLNTAVFHTLPGDDLAETDRQLFEFKNVVQDLEYITPEQLEEFGFSDATVETGGLNPLVQHRMLRNAYIKSDDYKQWLSDCYKNGAHFRWNSFWPIPHDSALDIYKLAEDCRALDLEIKIVKLDEDDLIGFVANSNDSSCCTDIIRAYVAVGYLPPHWLIQEAMQIPQSEDHLAILNEVRNQAAEHMMLEARNLAATEFQLKPAPIAPQI